MVTKNWYTQAKRNKRRVSARRRNYFTIYGRQWSADVIYSWLAINPNGNHMLFQNKPVADSVTNTWKSKPGTGHSINKQIAVFNKPMYWSTTLIAISV